MRKRINKKPIYPVASAHPDGSTIISGKIPDNHPLKQVVWGNRPYTPEQSKLTDIQLKEIGESFSKQINYAVKKGLI